MTLTLPRGRSNDDLCCRENRALEFGYLVLDTSITQAESVLTQALDGIPREGANEPIVDLRSNTWAREISPRNFAYRRTLAYPRDRVTRRRGSSEAEA